MRTTNSEAMPAQSFNNAGNPSRYGLRLSMALLPLALMACHAMPSPELDPTPDLRRFNRFDLTAQSSSGSAAPQQRSGTLDFDRAGASFEVRSPGNPAVDRLFVQPEACRDDASAECKRRFVVSGRIAVGNTSVNCYLPIRNDSNLGYAVQSLTGICQERNSRLFSLTIFSQ